jgi:hypothetical protein
MIKKHGYNSCFAVDINPNTEPDLIDDGKILASVSHNTFKAEIVKH